VQVVVVVVEPPWRQSRASVKTCEVMSPVGVKEETQGVVVVVVRAMTLSNASCRISIGSFCFAQGGGVVEMVGQGVVQGVSTCGAKSGGTCCVAGTAMPVNVPVVEVAVPVSVLPVPVPVYVDVVPVYVVVLPVNVVVLPVYVSVVVMLDPVSHSSAPVVVFVRVVTGGTSWQQPGTSWRLHTWPAQSPPRFVKARGQSRVLQSAFFSAQQVGTSISVHLLDLHKFCLLLFLTS